MNSMMHILVGTLLAAVLPGRACVAATSAQGALLPVPAAPLDSTISVNRTTLLKIEAAPMQRFYKAHKALLEGHNRSSASEIHFMAAFLDLAELDAVDAVDRQALDRSAEQLATLADSVEAGKAQSVLDLDPVFSKAYKALARHHHRKAWQAWQARQWGFAGQHLAAATDYFEQVAASGDHVSGTSEMEAIRRARAAAAKLLKGTGWVPEEVGKAIRALGAEIEKL